LTEALGVDGWSAADHADGGEFSDFIGQGHENRDRAEGLVGEGGVEAGEDDAFAEVDQLHGEVGDSGVEELDFVEADDVDLVDAPGLEELGFETVGGGCNYRGVMGLGAVAGYGRAVVAEIDVGLEAGDALAGDAGAFEAADEFFGFAGEHGAGDDFDTAWGCCRHWEMVPGLVVDFWVLIFLAGGVVFCWGFCEKSCAGCGFFVVITWFFDGDLWFLNARIPGDDFFAGF
jgi:hypothetical protein